MDILESLEDWGVKSAVDKVLDNYTTGPTPLIPPKDRPAFERVSIDIANAVIALVAQKAGVTAGPAGDTLGSGVGGGVSDEPI